MIKKINIPVIILDTENKKFCLLNNNSFWLIKGPHRRFQIIKGIDTIFNFILK